MTTGVETDRNKIKTYLHTCVQTYLERIISLVTFHLIDVKVKILFFGSSRRYLCQIFMN